MPRRAEGQHDKDQEIDVAGERGGATGPSSYVDDGPQAEKGDARRDKPTHSGPTRHGTSNKGKHGGRSGSDSNASN